MLHCSCSVLEPESPPEREGPQSHLVLLFTRIGSTGGLAAVL